jgi:hypothetical protein
VLDSGRLAAVVRSGCGRLTQTDGRLQAALKAEYDAAMADPEQAEQIKALQATMADPGVQQQMAGVSAMMNVRFVRAAPRSHAHMGLHRAAAGSQHLWALHS